MKSILLIGLGRFGRNIARELSALNHQVLAIDRDEESVNAVLPFVTDARIGECTNERFLRSLGVGNFDVCFVTLGGDFQSSLEITSLLKELGARLVISRAEWDVQEKFLLRNGADEVLYPEKQMAKWAAIRFSAEHILDYFELDDTHSIFEVPVPSQWVGHSVGQIDIRRKYGINILATKKQGKIDATITPETVFTPDKTLLVLSDYKSLKKCFRL